MTELTNIEIAILQRVNELAARHGLKPTDFVAVYRSRPGGEPSALEFETVDARVERPFVRMANALGLGPEDGQLEGTDEQLLNALDAALAIAPRPRRGR